MQVLTFSDEANGIIVKNLNVLANMVSEIVNEADDIFGEDEGELTANLGANFGFAENKTAAEGGVEFTASQPMGIPLVMRLDEAKHSIGGNQAMFIRFKPSAKRTIFIFNGNPEGGSAFNVDIDPEGRPGLYIKADDMGMPCETDFRLEPGEWHNLFVAIDDEGSCRCVLWKENYANSAAYVGFDGSGTSDPDGYREQSWQFEIFFSEPSSITVSDYVIFTFNELK